MGAGLNDPFTGQLLLLLRQIAVLRDDFDGLALGGSDYAFDVSNEHLGLPVLEGRDVHHHVDLFRSEIEDLLRLIQFHRRRFVAVRKADHGSHEDAGSSHLLGCEPDVMGLNGERGGA